MNKKSIKEYLVFAVIAVISAGFILATTRLDEKKYYPLNDNKMQIVFLGDSNIANQTEGKTIPDRVADILECDVYNAAVGGTTAGKVNVENYFDRTGDLFCLYNVYKIMEIENCQPLLDFRGTMPYDELEAIEKMKMLVGIDYEEIDYIVISYGINDYTAGISAGCENDTYDEVTYEGALRSAVECIHKLSPDSTIIISSITYCAYETGDGIKQDGYSYDLGGGYIEEYRDVAQGIASEYENVVFMDNLALLDIDYSNHEQYLLDGIHFNKAAQELYAKHLVDIINEIESSKDE